jgi:hypothetical protein
MYNLTVILKTGQHANVNFETDAEEEVLKTQLLDAMHKSTLFTYPNGAIDFSAVAAYSICKQTPKACPAPVIKQ